MPITCQGKGELRMPDLLAQQRWWLPLLSYLVLLPLFAGVHASVFSLLPVPQPRSWLWTFVLNPAVLLLSLGAWCLAAYALGMWLRTWWWPPIGLVATLGLTIGWGVPFSFR
jgi:hypothetical protein